MRSGGLLDPPIFIIPDLQHRAKSAPIRDPGWHIPGTGWLCPVAVPYPGRHHGPDHRTVLCVRAAGGPQTAIGQPSNPGRIRSIPAVTASGLDVTQRRDVTVKSFVPWG